jgi:hypothetical protein
MAYSFPLSTANFMDLLPIQQMFFDAPEQVEMSQTGGGELLRADLAPMLWAGEIRLGPMAKAESAVPELMLDLLRPAGRTFYCYDARRAYPLLDPTGSILGAATPTIYALPAGGREMQLQALPVGYNLSPGDYLAFDYTVASVTRRALHRIVSDPAVVPAGGISPVFEVTPMIRTGAVTGTAVTLIKAACKAVLVPNSVSKGTSLRGLTRDMNFRWQQTLR